ncbi:DUF805 domain-containing protein [Phenylobacterium sp.]|uniref:DUF805 domain-containing protein n=1 Tax=Phenylobacterium sp. TaxID=1871053 RepID=UPI0011FBF503|nr:DUF805 domain-containing protein [Phenylobacterium sp.]THD59110.1 MAG: DUF805 domain-containing protein [Phenylobacterium sp.]
MPLDWKSLFSGKGRVDRTTFWTVQLLTGVFAACLKATATLFPSELMLLLLAPFFVANWVVSVFSLTKRLHDLGRSGWWMLLPLAVALLVVAAAAAEFGRGSTGALLSEDVVLWGLLLFLLAVGVLKGSPQPNRYGDPPKAMRSATA